MLGVFLAVVLGLRAVYCQRLDCRSEEVNSCIKLADPLLQSDHVFPSTNQDIHTVCNDLFPQTWSKFVDCIKQYTTSCLSQDQRSDFNRAVGDSINSVHKMCTNDDYKNDYLRHASCIKERSVEVEYCGNYYNSLLAMVKGSTPANQREICCTHSSFKDCVIAETESCPCTGEECLPGLEATGFARAMLDKALGFLLKQCQTYVPDERDCPIYKRRQIKQPRVEANNQDDLDQETRYEAGSYFPSGVPSRDERKEQDDWTSINGSDDLAVNTAEEQTTEPPTLVEPIPEQETTVAPILEPFIPQQKQEPFEDERRKPWIPSADIHSFDDIFNSVENTRAQELASGNCPTRAHLLLILPLCLILAL